MSQPAPAQLHPAQLHLPRYPLATRASRYRSVRWSDDELRQLVARGILDGLRRDEPSLIPYASPMIAASGVTPLFGLWSDVGRKLAEMRGAA